MGWTKITDTLVCADPPDTREHTGTFEKVHSGEEQYLSFSVLALDLQVVIGDLHAQVVRREMLDIQVDCELLPVGPHLEETQAHGTPLRYSVLSA